MFESGRRMTHSRRGTSWASAGDVRSPPLQCRLITGRALEPMRASVPLKYVSAVFLQVYAIGTHPTGAVQRRSERLGEGNDDSKIASSPLLAWSQWCTCKLGSRLQGCRKTSNGHNCHVVLADAGTQFFENSQNAWLHPLKYDQIIT